MSTDEILNLAENIACQWDWATEISRPRPDQLDVKVLKLEELVPIAVGLRVKRLGHLSAIVGLDLGPEANAMEVIYYFCPGAAVIALRVRIPRDAPVVPSMSQVLSGAEVFERELHEMFGIEINGLANTERLYLPESWPEGVYPMRKDFNPAVLSADDEGTKND